MTIKRAPVPMNKSGQGWRRVRDGENPGRIERSERRTYAQSNYGPYPNESGRKRGSD